MASLAVVAVGSANLDTMACVDEDFLRSNCLPKGDATPFSSDEVFSALKANACSASLRRPSKSGCGGCACNTAKVLACLGCRTGFCGGLGSDGVAQSFREALLRFGVDDLTEEVGSESGEAVATGEVLCLVTPDGERTFAYRQVSGSSLLTSAGLSKALSCAVTSMASGQKLGLVYFDVYTLLCPGNVVKDGMLEARSHGAKTGLNLGSFGIVQAKHDQIWQLLKDGLCDVLTLNEEEARALCSGKPAQEACAELSSFCELVVLTLGADGLWVAWGKCAEPERHYPSVKENEIVDSTGAGDFFAGGFLAAWLRRFGSSECTRWGSAAALAVLRSFGADLGADDWRQLKELCLADTPNAS
eukprot:TRINITY_DN65620_c0_g1_i1.p1 TRINITY_DN65620_c0_g1~~TRINITY_DN65620_c0_g1_i1.p1  ORF type:complete len:359 (+),score=75.99 TRINITY_DN65620_c0_g1_i1:74-1150(+)